MHLRKLVALAAAVITIAGSAPAFAGAPTEGSAPTVQTPTVQPATAQPAAPTAPASGPARPTSAQALTAPKGQVPHPALERTESASPAGARASGPATPTASTTAMTLTMRRAAVPRVPAEPRADTTPQTKSAAPTAAGSTPLSPQVMNLRQRVMQSLKTGWQKAASVTSALLHHPQRYHIGAAIIAGLEVGGAVVLAIHGDIPDAVSLLMAAAGTMGVGAMLHRNLAQAQTIEGDVAPVVTALDPNLKGIVNEVEQVTGEIAQAGAKSSGAPTTHVPVAASPSAPPIATPSAGAQAAPPKLAVAPPTVAGSAPAPAAARAAASTLPEVSTVKRVYSLLANRAARSDGSLAKASERDASVLRASSDSFSGDARSVAQHLAGAEAYTLEVKGDAFPVVNVRSNDGVAAYVFAPDGALLASGRTTKESPHAIAWDTSPVLPADL